MKLPYLPKKIDNKTKFKKNQPQKKVFFFKKTLILCYMPLKNGQI